MKPTFVGAVALGFAAAAVAAPPQEQGAQAEPAPERKICRTEQVTGSLTRRTRICLTEAQWREVHARTKKGLDDFVGGASGGCRAPNNPVAGTMCGG